MQYGIRLAEMYGENDMNWTEFCVLLSGLNHKTPLGAIVTIRSEEDKDMLKYFTKEQHRIRNEWRSKNTLISKMSNNEKKIEIDNLQNIFARAFL